MYHNQETFEPYRCTSSSKHHTRVYKEKVQHKIKRFYVRYNFIVLPTFKMDVSKSAALVGNPAVVKSGRATSRIKCMLTSSIECRPPGPIHIFNHPPFFYRYVNISLPSALLTPPRYHLTLPIDHDVNNVALMRMCTRHHYCH